MAKRSLLNDPLMAARIAKNDPKIVKLAESNPDLLKPSAKDAKELALREFLQSTSSWSASVQHILEASRDYSLYVNDDRAIPYVGDAFKHVQRVALWQMRNRPDKIKVVALGGSLAEAGLYVHGDVSCNNAISRLAAPYLNNACLLEGDGHFGSRLAPLEGIGAPRYVSVKRAKIAEAFLYNDLAIVPVQDNYDGSNKQPIHFLPLIPIVLLNGISGMGVGYSTDILPHKLSDIVEATLAVLKGKEPKPLLPHWERYDVTVRDLGDSKYEVWGKLEKLDSSRVRITELPPGIMIEDFRTKLIAMEDNDEIVKFVDRSTKNINIEIFFKRGTIKDWDDTRLLQFFKLVERMTERIVVRNWDGKSICKKANAIVVVKEFVEWRLGWYVDRYQHLIQKTNDELLFWYLVRYLIRSGFMKKLGTFANKAKMVDEVTKIGVEAKLAITSEVIDRAIGLATYRWTKEFEQEVEDKIKQLELDLADFIDILDKPQRRKAIFLEEVEALKKLKG